MAFLVPAHPLGIETRWAAWMEAIRAPVLEHVALVLNAAGQGLWRVLSIAAIAVVLVLSRRWLALLTFAAAELAIPIAVSVTKAQVGRPRPPDGLVHASGSAFPSGHAAYAAATVVALVLLVTRPGTRPRHVSWGLAMVPIAAMAWSRTYLEVHWLWDVVGGSLLGVAVVLLAFAAVQLGAERPPRARLNEAD